MLTDFISFLLVGRPPSQLMQLQFTRSSGVLEEPIPLERELPFAPGARLVVHRDGVLTTLDPVPRLGGMYRGRATWGSISATIRCTEVQQNCTVDAVLHAVAADGASRPSLHQAFGTMQCTHAHCSSSTLVIRPMAPGRRHLQLDLLQLPLSPTPGCHFVRTCK